MILRDLIQVVSRLTLRQKTELVAFIRNQSTQELETALDEILDKLHEMGVSDDLVAATDTQSARERLEALQALSKLL